MECVFLYAGTNLSGHNVCLYSIWSNLKCLFARVASKSLLWMLINCIITASGYHSMSKSKYVNTIGHTLVKTQGVWVYMSNR